MRQNYLTGMNFSVYVGINFTCTENFISRGNAFDAINKWSKRRIQVHLECYHLIKYIYYIMIHLDIYRDILWERGIVGSLFMYSMGRNGIDLYFGRLRNLQRKFLISISFRAFCGIWNRLTCTEFNSSRKYFLCEQYNLFVISGSHNNSHGLMSMSIQCVNNTHSHTLSLTNLTGYHYCINTIDDKWYV